MIYGVALEVEAVPSREILEALLEALAEWNARWYGENPTAPPPKRSGVRWEADRPNTLARFQSAPLLFENGVGSCGPIAAAAVGYQRAVERRAGRPVATTVSRHKVALRALRHNEWHAYHQAPWGLVDPTKGL